MLIFILFSGLNEARTQQKYKYYVAKNWDKFDCVVVVLDGRQGVNTEEQIDLLRFIEQQRQTNKDISVIVAFNKVDDPEDTEQSLLIKEARTEVERIFNIASTEQVISKMSKFALQSSGHIVFGYSPDQNRGCLTRRYSGLYDCTLFC